MIIRPATTKDLERFGGALPYSARVIAGELDGETVAIGGVYYDRGRPVVFSSRCADLTARQIVRGARAIMALAGRGPIFAIQEATEAAARTLRHFGFEPLSGDYWVRR